MAHRLLAALLLGLLIGLVAGDKVKWEAPLEDNSKKITPAGSVTLSWDNALHGVWQVPSKACPSAFTAGNGLVELVKPAQSGTYKWTPPKDAKKGDKFYLADPVPGNCGKGMLLTITMK